MAIVAKFFHYDGHSSRRQPISLMSKVRTDRSFNLPRPVELQRLLRESNSPGNRHKVEMVRQLGLEPTMPIAQLATIIVRSERTTRRYLQKLREEGVEQFLALTPQRRKLTDSELERLRTMIRSGELATMTEAKAWVESRLGTPYSLSGLHKLLRREFQVGRRLRESSEKGGRTQGEASIGTMEGKLVEFLNLLPTTLNGRDWVTGFRAALSVVLPYADRIGVSLNASSSLKESAHESPETRFIESRNTGDATTKKQLHMSAVDLRYSNTVQGIFNAMKEQGLNFEEYYLPVVREINLSKTTYIGTIVIFYLRSGPDFTPSCEAFLDRLSPFLTFCLSDGIARQHVGAPERRDFQENLDHFASEHRMTVREREIFVLHLFGISYDEISRSLSVAPATVRNHIASIHRKTHTGSRGDLLALLLGPGGFPSLQNLPTEQ